jgi:hypothetical protein
MLLKTVLLVGLLLPQFSMAGGTLGTDELEQLMSQKSEIRDFLRSSLQLSDSAYGEVRLGSHFKNLGGARIGPYTISAKSIKDGKPLLVVLCTKARFLDRKGRELSESRMTFATSIDEKLIAVMLLQKNEIESRPPCPDA